MSHNHVRFLAFRLEITPATFAIDRNATFGCQFSNQTISFTDSETDFWSHLYLLVV